MQLDNTEDVKKLLADIENLFSNLDDIKINLEKQIRIKDDETIDYLHELELGNLSCFEISKVSKDLIRTRKERRIFKDKLELVNTIKGYSDKYITKGIITDTKNAIRNIDTLINNHNTRGYVPKVVKDLKCARQRKETNKQ